MMEASSSIESLRLSFWQRRSWVLVVAIVLMTIVGMVVEYRRQVDQWTSRNDELAARAGEMLRGVGGTVTAAAAGQALVGEDGSVDPSQFRRYAETLLADAPGVLSVALERVVSSADRDRFEAGFGQSIFTVDEDGQMLPAPPSSEHLVVVDVWPDEFSPIIGRDLLADPLRREAALLARDTGSVSITRPIPLGFSDRIGVLLMVPLYPLEPATDDVVSRREAMTGMLSVGHYADVFLSDIRSLLPGRTHLRIEDGDVLLAETATALGPGARSVEVEVGNRTWTVTAEDPRGIRYSGLVVVLLTGMLLASLVGVAFWHSLVRSRQVAAAHEELAALVSNMQRGLLEEQLDLRSAGISAVARYVPAAVYSSLGGDWYDLFHDESGQLVLTVGDVTGHGVDAVLQMYQIRQLLIAFAFQRHSPGESLALVNQVLQTARYGSLIASVWIGKLDPSTGTLTFASAGHPPALLSRAPGKSAELTGSPGPLLNITRAPEVWTDHQIDLDGGSVVAIYTDGIIEARHLTLDEGIAIAKDALGDPARSLDEIADDLLAARPDPGRDDAAIVVLRLETTVEALRNTALEGSVG